MHSQIKDMQNEADDRKIPIQKVGIKGLRYPITVLDKENKSQNTVASINMYVDLPHHFKGTHMSRFIEIMNICRGSISVQDIDPILKTMIEKFQSETAHIEIRFPYFIKKNAPVSKAESLMDYDCAFLATRNNNNKHAETDMIIEACVPVTTLCPCSKEISEFGAHNQRSLVTVRIRSSELVWLEDIIAIAESNASSALYPLLKRRDEKYVTEHAFKNPRFAEDVVRSVTLELKADKRISWYQVDSENIESIHNHNAFASVTKK